MSKNEMTNNTNEATTMTNATMETASVSVFSYGMLDFPIYSEIALVERGLPMYFKSKKMQWLYLFFENSFRAEQQIKKLEKLEKKGDSVDEFTISLIEREIDDRNAVSSILRENVGELSRNEKNLVIVGFSADKKNKLKYSDFFEDFNIVLQDGADAHLAKITNLLSECRFFQRKNDNKKYNEKINETIDCLQAFYKFIVGVDYCKPSKENIVDLLACYGSIAGASERTAGSGTYTIRQKQAKTLFSDLMRVCGSLINGKLAKMPTELQNGKAPVKANSAKSAKAEISQQDATGETAVQ